MTYPDSSKAQTVVVSYDQARLVGRLTLIGDPTSSIWQRLRARSIDDPDGRELADEELLLSWPAVLGILRDYGTRQQQAFFGFRFTFEGDARRLASEFADQVKVARASRSQLTLTLDPQQVSARLHERGFTEAKRSLRAFQMRDVIRLASLPHGANFSVPGAGKTTVTLALHLLVAAPGGHLLVIAPKSAFSAWQNVVDECIDGSLAGASVEPFTLLTASIRENERLLQSGATRFLISYDLMVRQQSMLASYFLRHPVHVVLDESHRMKAGVDSQRGAFLLSVSPFFARRDILTGTPMPQGPQDLTSQLSFLWPGQGFDLQIQRGLPPRSVLGNLYVRTTKRELGLPKARRHFIDVEMLPGQKALYGVVRSETLRRLSKAVRRGREAVDFIGARRSVMRLLQLSANPTLALRAIIEGYATPSSGIVDAVIEEGPSSKMRAVMTHVRQLASAGKKVVVWTIFTDTIADLERLLADLNPVSLYGAVPSGAATDPDTREGRLARFHSDPQCKVIICNPAAAGEGISLHTVCHDAIYLDRSYVSTHYLQSIDRIHRLGLPADVETNIYIYRTKAPLELGSVDYSVGRRLASKIRGLEQLLDDTDLHELALDEENADDPVDYSVDLQDLVDLVEELEGRGPDRPEDDED